MEGMLDAAGVFSSADFPVIGTDPNGVVQAWNANVARWLGYPKEEAIGKSFLDAFVLDACKDHVKDVWSRACAGIDTVNFAVSIKSKSGGGHSMLFNIGACRDDADTIIGVIAIGHGSPIASDESSSSAVDTNGIEKVSIDIDRSSAAVVGVNTEGAITIWNQRASSLMGCARSEAMGKQFAESFVINPQVELVRQVFKNAFDGHDSTSYKISVCKTNAQPIDIVLNVAPRSDVSGNILGAICLGQELTRSIEMDGAEESDLARKDIDDAVEKGDIDVSLQQAKRSRSRSHARQNQTQGNTTLKEPSQQSKPGRTQEEKLGTAQTRERSRSRDAAKAQMGSNTGVQTGTQRASNHVESDTGLQCPQAIAGKAAGLTDLEICASLLGVEFGRVTPEEKKPPPPQPSQPSATLVASPKAGGGQVKALPKSKKPVLKRTKWWDEEEDVPEKCCKDLWEEPRLKSGLKLISEISPPGVKWTYFLKDESRRSFAGYLPCPLVPDVCEQYFVKIRDGTKWIQPENTWGPIPRKTAWMVAPGCVCTYKYGGVHVEPQVFPEWMISLMQEVMPLCGLKFEKGFGDADGFPNACNLNLYTDGSMSVGWHSDDEAYFQGKYKDIRIISMSFGAKRCFEIRLNWYEEGEEAFVKKFLGNGDICTMEGMVQKHMEHRVPPEDHVEGPRLNITWRWIVKHHSRCIARYKAKKKAQ